MARRASEARCVPGIEDGGGAHGEEHEPEFRPARGGQPRLVAIKEAAAADEPRRVGTATGQRPLPTDLVAPRDGPGYPVGPKRAGDDRAGLPEDFGGGQ